MPPGRKPSKPAPGFQSLRTPPEFDIRKGLHVSVLPETWTEFKILSFRRGLSCNEILEELVNRCVSGDIKFMKVLDELIERKRDGFKKTFKNQLSMSDAISLFKEFEDKSPWK